MHKRPILYLREPDVDTVLQRQLAKEGYRILPKVGLSDALAKDRDDYLSQREFDYFTRAHLDFLVTRDNMPVFAVEFDGAHHFLDDHTIENDVIKNRLCKHAGLPLLRVTSSEIKEYDKTTLLDYMLMRYVSWGKEYPSIVRAIEEFALTIGPDYNPDKLAVDLDPSFHFDLRHPFPARDIVLERLWRNHRIAWRMVKPERRAMADYLCDVAFGGLGPSENEQFHRCTRHVSVWRPGPGEPTPVLSEEVSVSLRSWLPLWAEVPSPDIFQALWGESGGPKGMETAQEIIDQFKIRAESMWFPELPGISAWGIAENYAEYLGFRAVERWAKKNASK
jgi:hypothetical protein